MMPGQVPELSVVIPVYNEEASVGATIRGVGQVVRALGIDHEILVVNDGSRDGTGRAIRQAMTQVPHVGLLEHAPNRGYGGALRAGFSCARYDWITFLPGDGQFDAADLPLLLERAGEADLVSGYRVKRRDSFIRKFNARSWNLLIRLLFGPLGRDVDCGFKLFRRDLLRHVRIESNGAMIDTELLAGAWARGFRIVEVPVTHRPRASGRSTGANLDVILRAFRDLVRFRWRLARELRGERAGGRR